MLAIGRRRYAREPPGRNTAAKIGASTAKDCAALCWTTNMHVILVGCGRVGSGLARSLSGEGHSVAVIDREERAFRRLPADFTGSRHVGLGFDRDILVSAGAERAGSLAAVTSGDNSNILAARIARETFGIEQVVARIYDPRRAAIFQRLGIATVATVTWTTDQIERRITGARSAVWTDATGSVRLVEQQLPAVWAGHRLAQLADPGRILIAAVSRSGTAQVGDGGLIGQEGDVVHLVVSTGAEADLEHRLVHGPSSH